MIRSLDLSLGEFEALAAKALRGAGYAWGVANDGAYAARVLAQHGLPAADIIAGLIGEIDHADRTAACPLECGLAAADLGGEPNHLAEVLDGRNVIEPLLLAPFVAGCQIDWPAGSVVVHQTSIVLNGEVPRGPTAIRTKAATPTNLDQLAAPPVRSTRALVSRDIYDILVAFAGRTYAPATEESRNSGAG